MIDLHAHILPGFDDGARSLGEARELAREAAAGGVIGIAATPHVRDDYPTSAERMERGVAALRADFEAAGVDVLVVHGGEVALERFWQLDEEELRRFTLGGNGRYLLLEFPYRGWPQLLEPTLRAVRDLGMRAVLAHPERNVAVQAAPERLEPCVRAGALVQITAASLGGGLGAGALEAARTLVALRLVHVLASDSHGPHLVARSGLAAGAAALADRRLARRLTSEVPAAILAGDDVD